MKPLYLGLFLTSEGIEEFWQPITELPLLETVHCHHLTLQFKPTDEQFLRFPLGVETMVKVIGWVASEQVQAFAIERIPGFLCQNKFPHITVAVGNGGKPKDSNTLLEEKGFVKLPAGELLLPVRAGYWDGQRARFKRPALA